MDHLIASYRNGTFEAPRDSSEWSKLIVSLYATRSVNVVPPTNFVEEMWLYCLDNLGDLGMLVGFYILMNTSYALGGLLFWFIDHYRILHKYKVQTDKYPTNSDYWKCLANLVQNYVLIIFPLIFFIYPFFAIVGGFDMVLPLPGLFSWCWQMFFLYHYGRCWSVLVSQVVTHSFPLQTYP